MLISHKLLRWVPYLLAPIGILALGLLATQIAVARIPLVIVLAGLLGGVIGIRSRGSIVLKPVALAGFIVASMIAGLLAWVRALRQAEVATWNPTPRRGASTP